MNRVPLRSRTGEIRAYALVDDDDYAGLMGQRWSLQPTGYAQGWDRDAKKVVTMHRVILGLTPGDGAVVDHINRNKLDNRRENLRLVSHSANNQNLSGARESSTTGVLHVHPNGLGYSVRIRGAGTGASKSYCGSFRTLEDAAAAAWDIRDQLGMPQPDQ